MYKYLIYNFTVKQYYLYFLFVRPILLSLSPHQKTYPTSPFRHLHCTHLWTYFFYSTLGRPRHTDLPSLFLFLTFFLLMIKIYRELSDS